MESVFLEPLLHDGPLPMFKYITGPEMSSWCCGNRLSFVFSELSREASSKQHDILRSQQGRTS
jgi:hypothetical protein